MARRYSYVLLSRRLLRAVAAATFVAAVMLLAMFVVLPLVFLVTQGLPGGSLTGLAIVVVGLTVMAAAVFGLNFLYVRLLSALATGAKRPITVLLVVVMVGTLFIGMVDVQRAFGPESQSPFWFFSLGALFIHVATAAGLVVGPMELRRADAAERAVLAEPRAGTGTLAEITRLLHLPDVRAFTRKGRKRAWALVVLSLLLEGSAFYTLLKWPDQLNRTAERPLPADISGVSGAVVAAGGVAIVIVGLLISFGLIRLLLAIARRCRMKARRLTLQTASDAVAQDPRPPVLFLRSFEEEQVPLRHARVPWFLRGFDPGSEYGTLEEMIVLNLTYVGPVVAVADPSRTEIPIGAARWRLDNDEWQRFVEEQIRGARLIVVGLAETAGLRWEIDAVRRVPGALDKTIFVCPPRSERSVEMIAPLADALGCSVDVLADRVEGSYALMAVCSADGAATVFVASTLTEMAYYVALRASILTQGIVSGFETAALTTGGGFPGTAIPESQAVRKRRTTPYVWARRGSRPAR